MRPVRHDFETRAALADVLAGSVADRLRGALEARGTASIAVPGGTTPGPFLEALCGADLDWPKVAVTLTDERWVPASHERSNHRLLSETLLRGRAAAATFVPLFVDGADPETGLAAIEAALRAEVLPLDVCVLGMGADMHVASLFPGGDSLALALSDEAPPVLPIRAPGAPEPRITLTAPVLRRAGHLILLITGEAKTAALETALADGRDADAPVRAVLRRPTPVEVYYAP